MSSHKPFNHNKFLIWAFVLAFLAIGFFTFFDDLSFTGSLISKGGNSSLDLSGKLTVPEISLNSEFERIVIVGGGLESFIEVENLELDLFGSSQVVLTGFEGKIDFDGEKIYRLKGEAKEVRVNGEVLSSTEGNTKVELADDFSYSELEIKENVFIKKLDYVTSGNLKLNQNSFEIKDENLKIRNFYGSLVSKEEVFEIEGSIDSLEIEGDSRVVVN